MIIIRSRKRTVLRTLLIALLTIALVAACETERTPASQIPTMTNTLGTRLTPTTTPPVAPTPTVALTLPATPIPTMTPSPNPTATPTPSPTLTPSPTPSVVVAATEPTVQRIRFTVGGTSATEVGTLPSGGYQRYRLGARAGQTLILDLAASGPIQVGVRGVNGAILQPIADGTAHWERVLPRTQDYEIDLVSDGPAVEYRLTVTIPVRVEASPTPKVTTYRNPVYPFEVAYPWDFIIDGTCPTEGIIDDPVVSFRLWEEPYYQGTNLLDACAVIDVDTSEQALSTCTGIVGPNEDPWGQETIHGILFSVVSRGGVAAGHMYDVISYRTIHAGGCYEISLLVHASNPGVYGPGTVSEFDKDAVMARLSDVRDRFRFTDG